MATFNQLITDYKTTWSDVETKRVATVTARTTLNGIIQDISDKVLEVNPGGVGSLPPNFLVEGDQDILYLGIIFRINYDLADDSIRKMTINKHDDSIPLLEP